MTTKGPHKIPEHFEVWGIIISEGLSELHDLSPSMVG